MAITTFKTSSTGVNFCTPAKNQEKPRWRRTRRAEEEEQEDAQDLRKRRGGRGDHNGPFDRRKETLKTGKPEIHSAESGGGAFITASLHPRSCSTKYH